MNTKKIIIGLLFLAVTFSCSKKSEINETAKYEMTDGTNVWALKQNI